MVYPCVSPLNPQSGASPIHRCAWSYDFDGCLDSQGGSAERSDQRSVQDCLASRRKNHRTNSMGKSTINIHKYIYIYMYNIYINIYKWKNPGLKWIVSSSKMEVESSENRESGNCPAMDHGADDTEGLPGTFFWPVGKIHGALLVPTSTSQN